jgi:hypothetical protein
MAWDAGELGPRDAVVVPLGEAAGCAAALAVRGKTDVGVFDGVEVRRALGKQGGGPFTDG